MQKGMVMQKFPDIRTVISNVYEITGVYKSDEIKTLLKNDRSLPEDLSFKHLAEIICNDLCNEFQLDQAQKSKLCEAINYFIKLYASATRNSSIFNANEKQIQWALITRLFIPYFLLSVRSLFSNKLDSEELNALVISDSPIRYIYYEILLDKGVATTAKLIEQSKNVNEAFRQWLIRLEKNEPIREYIYLNSIFSENSKLETFKLKLKFATTLVRAKRKLAKLFDLSDLNKLEEFTKWLTNRPKDNEKEVTLFWTYSLLGIKDINNIHVFIDSDLYHSNKDDIWNLPADNPYINMQPPSENDQVLEALASQAIRENHGELANTIKYLFTKNDFEIDAIARKIYLQHPKSIFGNCLFLYLILALHRDIEHEKQADTIITFLDRKEKYMVAEISPIYNLIKAEVLFYKGKYKQAAKNYIELIEKTENTFGWIYSEACVKGYSAASLADDRASFKKIYKRGYWKLIFKEPYKDVDDYIFEQAFKDAKELTQHSFASFKDNNTYGIIDSSIEYSGDPNYKITDNIGGRRYSYQIIEMSARNNIERVRALIEAGADINKLDSDNGSALLNASSLEMIELLKDADAKIINTPTKKLHKTPLSNAIDNCNPEAVSKLLSMGADVNQKCTSENIPPLHWALSKIANIHKKDKLNIEYGSNSYYREFAQLAQFQMPDLDNPRNKQIFEVILNDFFNNDKIKPLKEIVSIILNHPKLNINAKGKNGLTPLMLACEIGYVEIIDKILKLKPFINEPNDYGSTALHYTTPHIDDVAIDIAMKLLKLGADRNIKDMYRRKPIDYVDQNKKPMLYKLLNS